MVAYVNASSLAESFYHVRLARQLQIYYVRATDARENVTVSFSTLQINQQIDFSKFSTLRHFCCVMYVNHGTLSNQCSTYQIPVYGLGFCMCQHAHNLQSCVIVAKSF